MPRIRLLSPGMVQKIAAGEVVERPASVVKELVENAIDAEAGRIHVQMTAGGKQGLSVSDDGRGMDREDLQMCIQRHATSKLASPSDLFAIATLGFRGEALASIGAVSRLRIESQAQGADRGYRLDVEGGVERPLEPISRAQGTTVSVRQLFFNTPARRKFLRHVDTEARHITQVLVHLAAAYPAVGFELTHQQRRVFHYPSGTAQARAADLLKVESQDLAAVEWDRDGIRVWGYILSPAHCQVSRGRQFLQVRARPILSKSLADAVRRGYGGLLAEQRQPAYVLHIDIDPAHVDVNVHPAKQRVRFADEALVARILQEAVGKALDLPESGGLYGRQDLEFKPVNIGEAAAQFVLGEGELPTAPGPLPAASEAPETAPSQQLDLDISASASTIPSTTEEDPPPGAIPANTSEQAACPPVWQLPPIWQIHDRFCLMSTQDGLALIDRQAAHQRVLYEEFMNAMGAEGQTVQQLLIPLTLELPPGEMATLKEAWAQVQAAGFDLDEFGPQTVLVQGIPAGLRYWNDGQLLRQILADLMDGHTANADRMHQSLAQALAKRSAVRPGEPMQAAEAAVIVQRLLRTEDPWRTPDGQPIMRRLTLKEIRRLIENAP